MTTRQMYSTIMDFENIIKDDLKDRSKGRKLESNEDFTSYLVNATTGEEYDPYSLAWRYLGMFLDCGDNGDDEYGDEDDDEDGGDNGCQRNILWAAVRLSMEITFIFYFIFVRPISYHLASMDGASSFLVC